MDISKLLDSIKLSPKYLFAIFLAGFFFLVAPAPILGRMSLNDFWLRPYIGIVTILAAALLVAHGAAHGINRFNASRAKKREQREWQQSMSDTLSSLTPAEKQALQPYIIEKQNSVLFNISSGVAGGLEAKQILYRASSVGPWSNFPYNLQPWARSYLSKHPELLHLSKSEMCGLEPEEDID